MDTFEHELEYQAPHVLDSIRRRQWTPDQWTRHMRRVMSKNKWRTYPKSLMVTDQWRELTLSARRFLDCCYLMAQFKPVQETGKNRKRKTRYIYDQEPFAVPYNLCVSMGIGSHGSVSSAKDLLIKLGFIQQVNEARLGLPNFYRLLCETEQFKTSIQKTNKTSTETVLTSFRNG